MNKTNKRLSDFVIVFLMAVAIFGTQAFAADGVTVSASDFTVHQGETFTTTIFVPEGANIVDFEMTLKYDTSLLTLVNAEENEDIKGSVIYNTAKAGELPINYSRTEKNVTTYMPVLDVTFRVDDNIGLGSYDLFTVDKKATFVAHRLNSKGARSEITCVVKFPKLVIYEMGDVDLNGKIDIGDATDIRRHLAKFAGSILKDFRLSLADVHFDEVIDIADPIDLQRRLAKFEVIYGNRVNINFMDKDGQPYAAKSIVYDGTLRSIPSVPTAEGYSGGKWSLSKDEYIEPNYSHLTKNTWVYAYYTGHDDPAMDYYKKTLANIYYSGDLPTNLSSDQKLQEKLYYQEGMYANLTWSSDCNYVLNSTTGAFTQPTYPKKMSLTATITSYDAKDKIDAEETITFDYQVPGIYITPKKSEIADFLKFYFTDSTDGKYRINYDVKLLQKVNNTVLPAEGALYDNFEIRLNWYQNVNGKLVPVNQIKRTTSSQTNDYVAVATFNGDPIEGDGKIYIDDVTVTPIDQMEIKNYIIQQIAAKQGTLATNNTKLWNNDTVYGTTVRWESGNMDIAYVEDNVIKLKDDAISGSTLPLNARVTYPVDGGVAEFVLSYNLTVSCNNTIIKAPENMDPGLYKAIKMELEDNLGYRGDLTSAALANVKFVNLDLSKYQKMAEEYEILRAEHPEQYPDDTYPPITSFRGLSYCKNLRTLNISGIEIADASMNQIATLSYLEAFIARGCNLDNLTDGGTATLRNATGLKMLDLTDNNFTSLDSVFAPGVRYGSLREVYLSKNKLTDINALSRAPMMTYLSLSENGLTTAGTASIANYPYLVYLSLAHNQIDSVEHLKNLKFLKELRLHDNNLSNVNDLRRLVNLEALYLGHNKIKDIGFLNTLTRLEILYVNDNQISDISALRDLAKLEAINVSNNKINSLSVLMNYKKTLTEIYAENNAVTDFSFINGASKLHILMLAGNKVTLPQDNMSTWLGGLGEMQVLTLSDIRLNDLAFLPSMTKLVRLDVANCGLKTFSGETSNLQQIADRYEYLKVLDISNNDFSDGAAELLKLRNVTLLTVLYADNVCADLDAYTLTYSMPELRFISMENCGIKDISWLYKYAELQYVDLAGNKIANVDIEGHISNASVKTLKELYLDTTVPCTFANAYRVTDFNVEKLSLEGVTIDKMEYMPYLDNVRWLNLSKTGLKNLTGADAELQDLYSLERYSNLETVDVSHIDSDISVLENMPSVKNVYAVGAVNSKRFYQTNLHTLQRLYNKGLTCYLYDKQNVYKPVATVEGKDILNLLKDISCDVTVAADNVFSDNNPTMVSKINDYKITWTVSNTKNYKIEKNHLAVKDYTGIEDETLTITASIKVYPDQEPVKRTFKIKTHILRATPDYYEITADGYSESLTRDANYSIVVKTKANQTEGFKDPVKPVEDEILFTYSAETASGTTVPYTNIVTVEPMVIAPVFPPDTRYGIQTANGYTVNSGAPLGAKFTAQIDICHTSKDGSKVNDIESVFMPVTVASRTFTATFVLNGGQIVDKNGVDRSVSKFVEDSLIFTDLTVSRLGYIFEGWYADKDFKTLVSVDGAKVTMPSHDLTLYAKWKAHSFKLTFNANGGTCSEVSRTVLCDTALGKLPTATRENYNFAGWYTAASGGTAVSEKSSFATATDMVVYAHWTPKTFTVTFDANGGTPTTTKTLKFGDTYGTLPTVTRDYYTCDGWFTAAAGGTQISANTKIDKAQNITVYAHWTQKPIKGFVKANELPKGAQVVERKWSYTLTSYKDSRNTSESGWSLKSSEWIKSGSGSFNYASFPSGFDTGNWYYQNWNRSAYSSYENATSKRDASNRWGGYIYWHWMYDCGGANAYNRAIWNKKGTGPSPNYYYYQYFGAFNSTSGFTEKGYNLYCNNCGMTTYYNTGRTSYADSQGSYYWFRFDYRVCDYTDYYKLFHWYKTENKESTSNPTGTANVSNVVEWVKYREK